MSTYPRVTLSSNAVVTRTNTYLVSGCQQPAWTLGTAPACVTGNWLAVANRVFAGGDPVVLFDSQSQCTETGTPLRILQTQARVTGS